MDLLLNIPDELCETAQGKAVEEQVSLSSWVVSLVQRELAEKTRGRNDRPQTWMDAFSGSDDDAFLDRDFPLEDRKSIPIREFSFED